MRGDAGNSIGSHRRSRDATPCWPVPKMPKAARRLISMTRTTTPMRSIILFQLRYLLALKTVIKPNGRKACVPASRPGDLTAVGATGFALRRRSTSASQRHRLEQRHVLLIDPLGFKEIIKITAPMGIGFHKSCRKGQKWLPAPVN